MSHARLTLIFNTSITDLDLMSSLPVVCVRERERERGSKLTDGLKNRRSTNCGYNISICESVMLSQLAETYAHDEHCMLLIGSSALPNLNFTFSRQPQWRANVH